MRLEGSDLKHMDSLQDIDNGDALLAQIKKAALDMSLLYNMTARKLPGSRFTPTLDEVEDYIKSLVDVAVEGYYTALEAAPDGAGLNEVEGYGSDDILEIRVFGVKGVKHQLRMVIGLKL